MELNTVEKGKDVIIVGMAVEDILKMRLQAFGIKVGSLVSIKQKGLFGGAYVITCEGQSIGMRRKDLMKIEVKEDD